MDIIIKNKKYSVSFFEESNMAILLFYAEDGTVYRYDADDVDDRQDAEELLEWIGNIQENGLNESFIYKTIKEAK